jgi:phage-related protein
LASTFKDQASTQADTFNGKMNRLKVAFEEGKETVGVFILDAITPIVDIIVDKVIPAIETFVSGLGGKDGLSNAFNNIVDIYKSVFGPILEGIKYAFDKIKDAVMDNKDSFEKLWNFIKDFLAPFLGGAFKLAIEVCADALSILVRAVAKVIDVFDTVFKGIKKAFDLLKDFVNFIKNNPVTQGVSGLFGGGRAMGGPVSAGTTYLVGENGPELFTSSTSGTIIPNQGGGGGNTFNITVNGALDSEGTARTIVNILNRSQARGSLGAGAFA